MTTTPAGAAGGRTYAHSAPFAGSVMSPPTRFRSAALIPTRIGPMPDGVTVHALEAGAVSETAPESVDPAAGWAEAVLSVEDPAFFSAVQAPPAATARTRAIVRTMISAERFAVRHSRVPCPKSPSARATQRLWRPAGVTLAVAPTV